MKKVLWFTQTDAVSEEPSLSERVGFLLADGLKRYGYVVDQTGGMTTLRKGPKVFVVDIKTGNPDLPLPSSTPARMELLKREAGRKFAPDGVQEILPVVVTNYKVSEDDKSELTEGGIKLVPIASETMQADSTDFSNRFAQIAGLSLETV